MKLYSVVACANSHSLTVVAQNRYRAATARERMRGVTLMEMMVVAALLALLAGITFPSVNSGLDSLRLSSATNSIVSFLNGGLNRAQRRQQVMEVTIARGENTLRLRSSEPGFQREMVLPDGVEIAAVLPPLPHQSPYQSEDVRRFMLYPGGTVPRFGVEIVNRRGSRRIVRVDPATGVPQVERVEQQ